MRQVKHSINLRHGFLFREGKLAKKLTKLMEWLTLADAAKHLSLTFNEEVTEADILRLALDGRLLLSVRMVNAATGRLGKLVPIAEAEFIEVPSLDEKRVVRLYKGPTLYADGVESHVVELEGEISTLSGVYDLPMIGAERLDVEQRYQKLTGGTAVTQASLDGAFVEGKAGMLCQLHERSRSASGEYHPTRLPDDHVLVVRVAALLEFEQLVNDDSEKPVSTRERNTLFCIIAALCHAAEVDFEKPSKAAGYIQRQADQHGISIGETTIEGYLKRIPEAIRSRTR